MNKNISTEKFLISLTVSIILPKRTLNEVHDRANLKTLSNLTALSADMAPPPPYSSSNYSIIYSIKEIMTTVQSKRLKLSTEYSLKPNPIIFIIISLKNVQLINSF